MKTNKVYDVSIRATLRTIILSDKKIKNMKSNVNLVILSALIMITLFTGCSEDEENIKPAPVNELVSVAGGDRTIEVDEVTTLDGTGSYDGNDQPFYYSWSAKIKPIGSLVHFATPYESISTFTANKEGIYIIELKITQGKWTATDNLVITVNGESSNTFNAVVLNQDINSPRTLANIFQDPTQPDYIVTNDIHVRADLVIMPGVVIAFQNNTGLQILQGALIAKGSATSEIVFQGIDNTPASWKGIVIHTNNEENELQYVTVKQGGSIPFTETNIQSNVTLAGTNISGSTIKITHSSFEESGDYGLYVQGSSYLNTFTSSTLRKNKTAAFIPARELHKLEAGIQIINNQNNVIETGGEFWFETEISWPKQTVPYRVTSDLQIKSGLRISPGASFETKEGVSISVTNAGFLEAIGSADEKILFTAIDETKPWNGIFINTASSRNKLQYCEIIDAGKNKTEGATIAANIAVGADGILQVENSLIKNSLTYGIAAETALNINEDVASVNTFINVRQGPVYPNKLNQDWPSMTGVWLDRWSFNHGSAAIATDFFNAISGTWFGGAERPWEMSSAGFGITFNDNGTFTWTIAEDGPMNGCGTFSAEFITGSMSIGDNSVTFNQDYWRSKFVNPCDNSWNSDTEVAPQNITILYEINKMYNVFTGEGYWKLIFTNPDNSTFTFYR
jgi:hypothetical protein